MAHRLRYDTARRLRLMLARVALAAALATVTLAGVLPPAPVVAKEAPSYALVAVQRAIDAGNRAYVSALVKKDAAAFGDLFTPDAVSMPSTAATIHGRDAIVASMTGVFARMTFVRGKLRTLETHLEGPTASEIGSYTFDVIVDGNARTLSGRYLVIWRDVGGGAWKIAVDSSQPGAPAE